MGDGDVGDVLQGWLGRYWLAIARVREEGRQDVQTIVLALRLDGVSELSPCARGVAEHALAIEACLIQVQHADLLDVCELELVVAIFLLDLLQHANMGQLAGSSDLAEASG
ncbi:hypothetical protein D3C80_1486570 [compost metagenome]